MIFMVFQWIFIRIPLKTLAKARLKTCLEAFQHRFFFRNPLPKLSHVLCKQLGGHEQAGSEAPELLDVLKRLEKLTIHAKTAKNHVKTCEHLLKCDEIIYEIIYEII